MSSPGAYGPSTPQADSAEGPMPCFEQFGDEPDIVGAARKAGDQMHAAGLQLDAERRAHLVVQRRYERGAALGIELDACAGYGARSSPCSRKAAIVAWMSAAGGGCIRSAMAAKRSTRPGGTTR